MEAVPSAASATPTAAGIWHARLAESPGMLGEVLSKELFSDYGIPVVQTRVAHSADEAVAMAERLSYPVVMKVLSPEISHKTDAGGVLLNLADADAVRAGYSQIVTAVRNYNPQAHIEGIAIQRMVSAARGVELLLGMTRDPQFGPVILLGAGGVTAELQRDSVLELPPLDDSRIDRMLRSLRIYPLLEGYRGRPGVNLPRLREVVANFVQLVEDLPEISTVEINPLLVTAEEVIALDARLVSDAKSSAGSPTPPSPPPPQLAIRPYPLNWHWNITLRDGTPVTIRPTHPGDEAALTSWTRRSDARAWLSNSESVWWADLLRFPERGCYLDYDRELVLVATDDLGDWCGVMRLHRLESAPLPVRADESSSAVSVSFDMHVRDNSRGAGLGTNLLQIGVEITRQWRATTLECCVAKLGITETDWLRRHGFVQQPSAIGVRFLHQVEGGKLRHRL